MRTAGELRSVKRCAAQLVPKGRTPAQREGLRYERKVRDALRLALGDANVVHNPWFIFEDAEGSAYCCPDFIITLPYGIVVIEVKLSYVDEAIIKLRRLYCPVVAKAFGEAVTPLVICRHLTPLAPPAASALGPALSLGVPLMHWLGLGPLPLA